LHSPIWFYRVSEKYKKNMLNKKLVTHFICCLLFLGFALELKAQTSVVSPYSRIGVGELQSPDLSFLQGSGLSSSFWSYRDLNLANPASYAYLRTASLNIGFNVQYNNLRDDNSSTDVWSGGLNTIAIGFPLINTVNELLEQTYSDWRYGSVIALQPYSGVGYDMQSTEIDAELGSVISEFSGTGGTQLAFIGQSIRYKNTSIGANLGYLFGSLEQSREVTFADLGFHYRNVFEDDIKTNGFYWKVGFMHDIILNRSDTDPYFDDRGKPLTYISIGLHGKPATGFNSKSNSLHMAQHLSERIPTRDTLLFVQDDKTSGQLPPEFGLGASYNIKDKLMAGFDIQLGLWSQYENDAREDELKNSFRMSVGGAYTPDHNSIHSFFERVTYRAGLYYYQDPRVANGQQLEEYGLTFGMSLPFIVQRNRSTMHTTFKLGRRGIDEGLRETFFNMSFGFTVNDNTWFIKRRFD